VFLEIAALVCLGSVLGIKWFTTVHTAKLSENLTVAENDENRFRGRYKKVVNQRKAIASEMKEINVGFQAMEGEVQDLEEELYEIDQRNTEIKEQIDRRD
jgi:predicted  nucleic acid-binding Zn-ribbon protein